MSRWNETVILMSAPNAYQDSKGAWHEGERVEREVYCDAGILGTMTLSQLRSSEVRITSGENVPEIGLRSMHVIYVKQIDYEGEDRCVYRGEQMDVIAATTDRENYKLIIRKRIGND